MTQVMEQIKRCHQAEPFKPFALILVDGTRVAIPRREFLGWFPRGDRVFYSSSEDTTEVLDVKRIARVEPGRGADERKRRRAG